VLWLRITKPRSRPIRGRRDDGRIAEDETRHAELAWQVAAWLEPQLSEAEQRELARVKREAVAQLSREVVREELGQADAEAIGWPCASSRSSWSRG